MATAGLLHQHVHPHHHRPKVLLAHSCVPPQDSRSLLYRKFTLGGLPLSPQLLPQIYFNRRPLTRCLKHQEQLAFVFPAQSEADVCSDIEAIEWVNNTVHDPMVEVDPGTVLRGVLAERRASLMRVKGVKASIVMESTSLPRPFLFGIRRPSGSAIGIAMAVMVLAVTAAMYFFRSSKNKDKKKMHISVKNGSGFLEPRQKLVKDAFKASDSVLTAMTIGAASLGRTKGHNAITSPAFENKIQHEGTEGNAVVNSHCESTIGNHPPFKVQNVGVNVAKGPWFRRIEHLECETTLVQSQGLQFAHATTTLPPPEQCVGRVSVGEVQFKRPLVDGDFYGEVVSANLATKQLVEPKVDSLKSELSELELPPVDGKLHNGVVSANHSKDQLVETKVDSSESDSSQSELSLGNGEFYGEFRSVNLATEQPVEPKVDSSESDLSEFEPLLVDGEFYGEVNLATEQLVEPKVDRSESESSEGDNIRQPDSSGIVEKLERLLEQGKLDRVEIDDRVEDMLGMEKNGSMSDLLACEEMINALDLEPDAGDGNVCTDIDESRAFSYVDRSHTHNPLLAVETADAKYNFEDMHLIEGNSASQGLDVMVPSKEDLFERVDEGMESAIQDPNVLKSMSSQQAGLREEEEEEDEEEEGLSEEDMEQGLFFDIDEEQLLNGSMSSNQIHLQGSAAEGDSLDDGALDDPAEDARQKGVKALEAAAPAFVIGVGTVGTLFGVAGGLQVMGFAALVSFISRELIWAQSRESLLQELSDITDRQKLLDFLKKRNIVR